MYAGARAALRLAALPSSTHQATSNAVKGYMDGNQQPVDGSIRLGWDYCSCYHTKTEIEKAAESKRYFDLDREGALGCGARRLA